MSSKDEIKTAFINELKLTPQYQEVLSMKQFILDEIARPNIQIYLQYTYSREQTDDELQIIKLCFLCEFGYQLIDTNNTMCNIDMNKFIL